MRYHEDAGPGPRFKIEFLTRRPRTNYWDPGSLEAFYSATTLHSHSQHHKPVNGLKDTVSETPPHPAQPLGPNGCERANLTPQVPR